MARDIDAEDRRDDERQITNLHLAILYLRELKELYQEGILEQPTDDDHVQGVALAIEAVMDAAGGLESLM